jgi:hypothetical protein
LGRTEGCKAYPTALLTHGGPWVHLPRSQATGPAPPPRGRPVPQRLSAPGVQTVRRRRLGDVTHRVVFGTREAIPPVRAGCGGQIPTAVVERVTLAICPQVAARGRRVTTLGTHQVGVRQPLSVDHVDDHFG